MARYIIIVLIGNHWPRRRVGLALCVVGPGKIIFGRPHNAWTGQMFFVVIRQTTFTLFVRFYSKCYHRPFTHAPALLGQRETRLKTTVIRHNASVLVIKIWAILTVIQPTELSMNKRIRLNTRVYNLKLYCLRRIDKKIISGIDRYIHLKTHLFTRNIWF